MSETQNQKSPVAQLVLFMVCLAVLGTILAGAHYIAIDLPQQIAAQQPPSNGGLSAYDDCMARCTRIYNSFSPVCAMSCSMSLR